MTFFRINKNTRCLILGILWLAGAEWDPRSWGASVSTVLACPPCSPQRWYKREFRGLFREVPTVSFWKRRHNHGKNIDECSLCGDNTVVQAKYSGEDRTSVVRNVKTKIPTPWPINVIQERWRNRHESSQEITGENKSTKILNSRESSRTSTYPSMGALFLAYAKQQARIGCRQLSEISAQIWYNLPPSAPPLILLASFPRKAKVLEKTAVEATSTKTLRRIIPLFSDPFARSAVLAGMGMAVVSWSNQELQRKRKLTPLPLSAMSDDQEIKGGGRVSRVFLPPFLPEDVSDPEIDALRVRTKIEQSNAETTNNEDISTNDFEENTLSNVSPKIRRHLNDIYETTTTTSKRFFRNYYQDWLQGRAVRKREVTKIRRNRIFDELVALQALKKSQAKSRKKSEIKAHGNATPELGYALVTGASRGIGRAIAVELARWEIPLVLVARDVSKLTKLASDLEICYGIKCCILEADLTKADAAEKIHQATTAANIPIDILINNAGIASEGLAIDQKTSSVERMIMLNSLTYSKLSVLYGRDMKKKRKGRILMMSSMAGLCNASPNTAIYGACKAFGKSLALSMAKELESYGVGVTVLIPGPVSGTDFRTNSGTHKALCWYLPFYSRSPEIVAHQGVISLLDGDTQSIPGWQNRAFANIVRPIIPQRLEIMLIQRAFSPLRMPSLDGLLRRNTANTHTDNVESRMSDDSAQNSVPLDDGSSWLSFKSPHKMQPPPRFLKLPNDEFKQVETKNHESINRETINDETVSSSPTNSEVNSTKCANSRKIGGSDEKILYQANTTVSNSNSDDQFSDVEIMSDKETKVVKHQSQPFDVQQEQQLSDLNVLDSGSDRLVNERLPTKQGEPTPTPNTLNRNRKIQKENNKHNEKIINDRLNERATRPQWFGYNDEEDDTFSTRLGPITRREPKEMTLPKQTQTNCRESTIIVV